jgi:hypothetical protein
MDKVIKLHTPITSHGKVIDEVTIREPKYKELAKHGDIFVYIRYPDGSYCEAKDKESLSALIEKLISITPIELDMLSLADGMQVQEAVNDFFLQARMANMKRSQESSSSI